MWCLEVYVEGRDVVLCDLHGVGKKACDSQTIICCKGLEYIIFQQLYNELKKIAYGKS